MKQHSGTGYACSELRFSSLSRVIIIIIIIIVIIIITWCPLTFNYSL